jgi:hypothetical protein
MTGYHTERLPAVIESKTTLEKFFYCRGERTPHENCYVLSLLLINFVVINFSRKKYFSAVSVEHTADIPVSFYTNEKAQQKHSPCPHGQKERGQGGVINKPKN